MSPDEVSSLFPDRPIRPLPTRRLREKLPPDAAHLIKFPPSSPEAPLFQYPSYSAKDDPATAPNSPPSFAANQRDDDVTSKGYWPVRSSAYDSLEAQKSISAETPTHAAPRLSTIATPPHSSALPAASDSISHFTQRAPVSTASSIDGYDSFENTNNKKKRKIPAAGDLGHGPHSLSNDIDALSISGRSVSPSGEPRHYSSTTHASPGNYSLSASSLAGPGRGRFGRVASGRSPLRTLPDSGNIWSNRALGVHSGKPAAEIARDTPKTPITPGSGSKRYSVEGQENMASQQSDDIHSTPTSSQFTFTCDSSVPGTIQWPAEGYNSISGELSKRSEYKANGGDAVGPVYGRLELPSSDGSEHVEPPTPPAAEAGRRSDPEREQKRERRRANKELKDAARQRKQVFQDDVRTGRAKMLDCCRMCEFCEYEAIFGEPPRFLIREFEERERDKKRAEADKKRLLEKARAKARKKRNGKNQVAAPAQPAAQTQPSHTSPDGQETQSEGGSIDHQEEYPFSPGGSFEGPGSEQDVAWKDPGG